MSERRLIETFQVLDAILGASVRLAAEQISQGDNRQRVREGLDNILAVDLHENLTTADHIEFVSRLHNFHLKLICTLMSRPALSISLLRTIL